MGLKTSNRCRQWCGVGWVLGLVASLSNAQETVADEPELESVVRVTALTSPAATQSRWPRLDKSPNGTVRMSWLEPGKDGVESLRFATLTDDGFDQARTISSGSQWFVNWADFPSVVANGSGHLAAHWMEMIGKDTYAYGIRVAYSKDRGDSWSLPFWLHRDITPAEHGFATLVGHDDHFSAVWLDGRQMLQQSAMTLRATRFDASGFLEDETLLDSKTCECCATDAVVKGQQLVVAYRDRSENNRRDIAVVRRKNDQWTPPQDLHDDGWVRPG